MLSGDVIPNKAVGTAMVECICICIRQLGPGKWLSFYHYQARDIIDRWQTKVGIERIVSQEGEIIGESTAMRSHLPCPGDLYDEVVGMWISNEEDRSEISFERSRASDASLTGMVERLRARDTPNPPFIQSITSAVTTSQWSINAEKLQKSWDVAQKKSREDYDEWMRKFSIQLLQEAPSPALRACAELAASYPPLARELFSSAFVCCWVELNEQSRASLVHSLQHVFASDASLEILQLLLNLCEFMEHDVDIKGAKGGLPIKINVLADLAIKCRAYSKALHYKEVEYIRERSGSCVEYLIDINKKLDLPEAALGVLKSAKTELKRRGSPVFTHNRTNSRDTKNLAYSVLLTDSSATAKQQNSWAGNVMYETWLTKLGSWCA
jgi:FKBP12-rapamycin complex-associated protein